MNLLVDIGNSRIKWAYQTGDSLSGYNSKYYRKEDFLECIDEIWAGSALPERIVVANVGGNQLAEQLCQWASQNWKLTPELVSATDSAFGVTNAYSETDRLGIDRWMALIAVWNKYRSAACIVGCGTAVTVDGLDENGKHMGGLILPGIMLMKQSLYRNTALKEDTVNQEIKNMANSTEQAIQSGCSLAIVGLVEHVLKQLQEAHGNLYCILTGGDAETIKPLLPDTFIHEPHLVLEGLSILAREKK